jgi:hypothetical protein
MLHDQTPTFVLPQLLLLQNLQIVKSKGVQPFFFTKAATYVVAWFAKVI